MRNFDYTKITNKSFDKAVGAVISETKNNGFKVLYVHNLKETLGKKGFEIEPLKIIEICSAKHALTVLRADIRLALCLPCKINVYVEDNQTYIAGMKPTILEEIFPDVDLGNLPQEIDSVIKKIVDNSAQSK